MYKLTYEDFVKMGSISKLPEIERENYIKFHEKLWKEDLEVAKKLGKENNRWAIIAGYYAMHNLTKLFLAKKFGVKITGKFVHAATLECFKERLKELNTNSKEKEELINLLSYAKKKKERGSILCWEGGKNKCRIFY